MKTQKLKKYTMLPTILALNLVVMLLASCSSTGQLQPTITSPLSEVSETKTTSTSEPDALATPISLDETAFALSLEGYGNQGALADQKLSILDMLTYAIQDEYTAHGEYLAIQTEFGTQRPYDNIMASEVKHIEALAGLFEEYGLEVPVDDSAEHTVIPATLLEAAKTGVQAEISNIAMYQRFLAESLPDDIRDVFTSLMKASESHLAAFERQVDKLS